MPRWLIKSEPHVYAFSQLQKDGKTSWDGVRNFEARNNLRAMKKGDVALYYHSTKGKEVVGVARVVREAYPDPTAPGEDWSSVEVAPVKALAVPVSLAAIKASAKLKNIALVKRSRISVVPLTDAEVAEILKMGKTNV
jgi:predicted RNA-binding protein with PUA-like domain